MKPCSNGHLNEDQFRFCSVCGELLPTQVSSPINSGEFPPPAPKPNSSGKGKKIAIWVVGVFIGLSVLGAVFGDPETSITAPSSASSESTLRLSSSSSSSIVLDWFPSGYTEIDDGVAMRWMKSNEYECSSISDGCWGIMVVARDGCGSLYVELALLDSSGVNVGMTNDIASGVSAGGKARMIFEDYGNGASKARVADVSCY